MKHHDDVKIKESINDFFKEHRCYLVPILYSESDNELKLYIQGPLCYEFGCNEEISVEKLTKFLKPEEVKQLRADCERIKQLEMKFGNIEGYPYKQVLSIPSDTKKPLSIPSDTKNTSHTQEKLECTSCNKETQNNPHYMLKCPENRSMCKECLENKLIDQYVELLDFNRLKVYCKACKFFNCKSLTNNSHSNKEHRRTKAKS